MSEPRAFRRKSVETVLIVIMLTVDDEEVLFRGKGDDERATKKIAATTGFSIFLTYSLFGLHLQQIYSQRKIFNNIFFSLSRFRYY